MHTRIGLIRRTRHGYRLDNGILARELECRHGILKTIGLVNRLTDRRFPVRSREWEIVLSGRKMPLCTDDFRMLDASIAAEPGKQATLSIRLVNNAFDIRLEVRYEVAPDRFFMRKTIRIESGLRLVKTVAVESFSAAGCRFTMGGFGQPLFMNAEVFMGLEYPAGYNDTDRRPAVRLRHYPGRAGTVDCKPAIWGVCPNTVNNRIRDWFLKYVDLHRPRLPQRLHTQYCAPNRSIASWKLGVAKRMLADQGLPIDALYVHSGENIYDPQSVSRLLPESRQNPKLSVLKQYARRTIGAGLGFHINTGGGRASADHDWFRRNFDMISPAYYCLADPRVKEQLQRNLTELIRKYDAEFLSFDWMWWKTAWECPHAGHRGHIPGARYGREAITDAFIDMATAWRREKPDIILEDLEVEHSPWWLFYADALWSYAGEGAGTTHPLIDGSIRGWTKTTVFPMNSIWYAVNPPYGWSPLPLPHPEAGSWTKEQRQRYEEPLKAGMYMTAGETPPREWADNVIMSFLRGSQINEIYYQLEYLTATERRLYAEIMRWALKHQEILLVNTTFVLGDPAKSETYGLTHFLENNRGIIGIYNACPWRNETVRLALDESAHFHRDGDPVSLAMVYPHREPLADNAGYGDTLELTVPGRSLVVLETRPAKKVVRRQPVCIPIGNPKPPAAGFVVRRHPVKRDASGTIKLRFDLVAPESERVRLHAFTETDFKANVLLAKSGARKVYAKARKEFRRKFLAKMRWTWQKEEECRCACETAVLRFTGAVDADTCSVFSNDRRVALKSGSSIRYRLIRAGLHPMRQIAPVAFARFQTAQSLGTGSIVVVLRTKWPHTKYRVWLEREGLRRGAGSEKTVPGQLPADWHYDFREVATVQG